MLTGEPRLTAPTLQSLLEGFTAAERAAFVVAVSRDRAHVWTSSESDAQAVTQWLTSTPREDVAAAAQVQ